METDNIDSFIDKQNNKAGNLGYSYATTLKSDVLSDDDEEEEVVYKTTWYRWLVLLLISNFIIIVAAVIIANAPSALTIAKGFDTSQSMINVGTIVTSAIFLPWAPVVIKLFETFKFATVLRFAVVCTLVGSWIRSFAQEGSFWVVILGNAIVGLGNPIFLSSISPLCNKWFGDNERSMAAALISSTPPLGGIVGLILGTTAYAGDEDASKEVIMQDYSKFTFHQNIYITASALLALIFLRSEPKNPPSSVALVKPPPAKFGKMIWEALKIRSYIIIVYVYGTFYGIQLGFGGLIDQIFNPYGYSAKAIALLGVMNTCIGVFAIYLFGFLLDKFKKFKLLLRLIAIGGTICWAICLYVIPLGHAIPTICLTGLTGFITTPCIPVCISFSAEVTFPMSPSMTNTVLQWLGHAIGLLLQVTSAALVVKGPIYPLLMFGCFALSAGILCLFVKEDLKRLEHARLEKEKKMMEADDDLQPKLLLSSNDTNTFLTSAVTEAAEAEYQDADQYHYD